MPREDHLRIAALLDDGTALSFVDQRTFGGWMLADLVTVDGTDVPIPVAHLARDPLDPKFNRDGVVTVLRRKHSEIKRQLLDQTVVSGIGNIYADEALWRARVNGARPASSLTRAKLGELLDAAADVMTDALGQGGTSFDSLYVNVNGESGYFERSLDAYGREGEPCRRCGAVMRREKFMNRSSFYCPKCQPRPRVGAVNSRERALLLADTPRKCAHSAHARAPASATVCVQARIGDEMCTATHGERAAKCPQSHGVSAYRHSVSGAAVQLCGRSVFSLVLLALQTLRLRFASVRCAGIGREGPTGVT